jgi:hypothetical protein
MAADPVAANSALVDRLDAWYDAAAADESRVAFEVLTSWTRAMGYAKPWRFAWGRAETPWGATLTDAAELAQLVGEPGTRAGSWSRKLDLIEHADDDEQPQRAKNERAWGFALRVLLHATPPRRSGRHPRAMAEALYAYGLVVGGMSQRAAARHIMEREDWQEGPSGQSMQDQASGRTAQYRRIWRALALPG